MLGLGVVDQQLPTGCHLDAVTATPWPATPRLRIVDTTEGQAYITQKGGCCLAYTCRDHAVDDSEQRQLFWIERRHIG